jgi:adenylate cyclase
MSGGEEGSRRLAAIRVANVAGYSRSMEADEEGTRVRPKSLRHNLIDSKIALDKGRTVKTASDAILVEAVNAVEAAPIAAG